MRNWSITTWRKVSGWACYGVGFVGIIRWLGSHHDTLMHGAPLDPFAGFGTWGWWGVCLVATGFAVKAKGNLLRMDYCVRRLEPWGIGVAIVALVVSMIQFQDERSDRANEATERRLSQKRIENELRFRNWEVAHDKTKPAQFRLRYAKRILETEKKVEGLTLDCFPKNSSDKCSDDKIHQDIFSSNPESPEVLEISASKFRKIVSKCSAIGFRIKCGLRRKIHISGSELIDTNISGINTSDLIITNSQLGGTTFESLYSKRIYIGKSDVEKSSFQMDTDPIARALHISGIDIFFGMNQNEMVKTVNAHLPKYQTNEKGELNHTLKSNWEHFFKNNINYQIVIENSNISGLDISFNNTKYASQFPNKETKINITPVKILDLEYVDKGDWIMMSHNNKDIKYQFDNIKVYINNSWFFSGDPPIFDFKGKGFRIFECPNALRNEMKKINPANFSNTYIPKTEKFQILRHPPIIPKNSCVKVSS